MPRKGASYAPLHVPARVHARISGRPGQEPADRIELAARPTVEAVGGKVLAAGYTFGEYDIVVIYEAPDSVSAAALAVAVAAGGAAKAAKTTELLSGAEWLQVLRKAQTVSASYQPPR